MMYSPETNTAELVLNLCQAYLGKNVNPNYADKCTEDEMNDAIDFIGNHFAFLENNDEMPTINSLVDKAYKLIIINLSYSFSIKDNSFIFIDNLFINLCS